MKNKINWKSFWFFSSLLLTLSSSIFLLKGNLGISIKDIAELSATKWDYNLEIVKSLATQSADSKAGIGFLIILFIFQIFQGRYPINENDKMVQWKAVLLSILLSIFLFFLAQYFSERYSNSLINQTLKILKT